MPLTSASLGLVGHLPQYGQTHLLSESLKFPPTEEIGTLNSARTLNIIASIVACKVYIMKIKS
jgi:hypothetical protein